MLNSERRVNSLDRDLHVGGTLRTWMKKASRGQTESVASAAYQTLRDAVEIYCALVPLAHQQHFENFPQAAGLSTFITSIFSSRISHFELFSPSYPGYLLKRNLSYFKQEFKFNRKFFELTTATQRSQGVDWSYTHFFINTYLLIYLNILLTSIPKCRDTGNTITLHLLTCEPLKGRILWPGRANDK